MSRARRLLPWAVSCAVLATAATAWTGEVVPDLGKVGGIGRLKGPPAARELLQRNGFVVVPRFYHQIFSPYIQEGLPPFVTTDSLHRTFHVIFEEQLKAVETAFAGEVAAISKGMADAFNAVRKAGDLTDDGERAARMAEAYFTVAATLLEQATQGGTDAAGLAAREVALIRGARGVETSPIFRYRIDYSQFKPRGFYTETPVLARYFRAMTWYGHAAFRLVSDDETRTAMMIAQRFARNEALRERWRRIDRVYTWLIGSADDLTPLEYEAAALYAMDASARDPLPACKKMLRKLRDPKINSMVIAPEDMPRWRELSKGMRFFGKRYLPDSEIFMHLTLPAVPGRGFPSGLDVMAANGSARAAGLLRAEGHFARKGYQEGFAASHRLLADLKQAAQRSHYVEFLRLIETLWSPPPKGAPPFLSVPAYADKNLVTALGAWASMRHAWQLQAKQSVTYMGLGDEQPPGYVEPNLAFFERLDGLVGKTLDVLGDIDGIDVERLTRFRRLVGQVRAIAEKQLAGKPLLGNDRRVLDRYGPTLGELSYFEGNAWLSDKRLPWMSLVADVHTEHLSAKTLEVATGGAMPIYVVVPAGGTQHLMVGGVYSYYEFRQPIADRLTDGAWRRRVATGKTPPMPGWTASFVAGFDAAALIERMRQGEEVQEAWYVSDPAIEAFLEKAIAPGGALDGKRNLAWAVTLYGAKRGAKALPTLLDYYTNPRGPREMRFPGAGGSVEIKQFREGGPRASGAARALASLAEPEHIPLFEKVALGADERRAYSAVRLIAGIDDEAASRSLLKLLAQVRPGLRSFVIRLLCTRGSRDVTPALLDLYPQADDGLRERILEALTLLWDERARREYFGLGPVSTLSKEQTAECRRRLAALVLEALKSPRDTLRREAVNAVAAFQLEEAIPHLERLAAGRFMAARVARALQALESAEADAALVRLLDREHADAQAYGEIIPAVAERRAAAAVPALRRLLDDTRQTRINDNRVCDWAAYALASLNPEGPGFWRPRERDPASRDILRDAWKLYLDIEPIGGVAKAEPARATALAGKLLGLVEAREASKWNLNPDQSIRWVLLAQRCATRAPQARREALSKRIGRLLVQLTRKEVQRIVNVFGYYKRDFGELPPDKPGHWEQIITERRYSSVDRARLDKQGRLCDPWGRPYRYHRPARHIQAPMELYSVGPNGRDEGGQGDDIANWQVE